jgi:hypothetical protein
MNSFTFGSAFGASGLAGLLTIIAASRKNVESAVAKHDLAGHSHFLDNEMRYWRALKHQYWPAMYVVDAKGQIRGKMIGEIHVGSARDRELSELVETLLREAAGPKL